MKKFFILLITLPWNGIACADEIKLAVSAPSEVTVGESFKINYTIETDKEVGNIQIPNSISGFDILLGPNRSQQTHTQRTNDRVITTKSITFSYILNANKEGIYYIPVANVLADGKTVTSKTIKINVLPKDKPELNKTPPTGKEKEEKASSVISNELFVKAAISKKSINKKESFLLTYKLYTLLDIKGFNKIEYPKFNGFIVEEVELPVNQTFKLEHYDGKNYQTLILQQFILFPEKTGEIVIEPANFNILIYRNKETDDSFFGKTKSIVEEKKTIYTSKLTVNVSPK